MRSLLCALSLSLMPFTAVADISGDDDRRYQNTKSAWLSGQNDLVTLRQFAALAESGNLAAQLTLGLIDRNPQFHFHATRDLESKDQRKILRKNKGRFGQSWLKVAAPLHPLAALLTQTDIEDYAAYATALAEAGQLERAYGAANLPFNQGDDVTTMRLLAHPKLLQITKASIYAYTEMMEVVLRRQDWVSDSEDFQGRADALRELRNLLPPLEFKDRLLITQSGERIRFDEISQASNVVHMRGAALMLHPDLKPLAEVLNDICPKDTSFHMGVLYHLEGGIRLQLRLESRLEPMISTQEWLNSDRFRGDLLRNYPSSGPRFDLHSSLSTCFTNAIEAAQ